MEKLLLRPMEAAEMLAIGRSRMYELLTTGALPSIRIGRSVRIPIAALNRWIEEQSPRIDPMDEGKETSEI